MSEANASARSRFTSIQSDGDRLIRILEKTGMGGESAIRDIRRRIRDALPTNRASDTESLANLENFLRQGEGRQILDHGESTHRMFVDQMEKASPYLSRLSYERWVNERFRNPHIGFIEKKYWIERQMPRFVEGWIRIGKKRDEIVRHPKFLSAMKRDPEIAILNNREAFLDLHFDKKEHLLEQAEAAMLASEKERSALYAQAKVKLLGAVSEKILSSAKVGVWLHRIFKPNVSVELIDHFVNGSGLETLDDLMQNWYAVKYRYDEAKKKLNNNAGPEAVRGFTLLTEQQFLSLHYDARVRYVEEAERRAGETNDVELEHPIFTKIKHAMDIKDWEEADELILEARSLGLGGKDRDRLNSMDGFVKQFSGRKESTEGMQNVTEAKKRIDGILNDMEGTHSQVLPMVLRLLRGPNANRSIGQFRWIVYNNKWCRDHGYLDQNKARKGASEKNQQITKERAERGEDIGMHDVVRGETAGSAFIRKEADAKSRATVIYTDVNDGAATAAVAAKMEKEQDAKVMYWTTFYATENGEPKSDNWHNDLFFLLSQLRSHTRTLKKAGFMYGGRHEPLIGLN